MKTTINYLPLEIWTSIFARMPVKTLIQFRCVCKSWCSIIDSPNFVHLHLQLCNINHNNKNSLVVALEGLEVNGNRRHGCSLTIRKADTFSKIADIFKSSERYYFLASCNGLILLCKGGFGYKSELRLWNPSIRKSLLIPACPIPSNLYYVTVFLFGFAPSTKDHKILAITFDRTTGTQPIDMFLAVYTLNEQRWTVRKNGFNLERSCFERIFWAYFFSPSDVVYFQGAVHARCRGKGNDKEQLVSLDFDLEEFTFSELPFISDKNYHQRSLFILRESLAIFRVSEVGASIWVSELDDGKRVWTLWFSAPSDGLDLFIPHMYSKVFYYESDDGGCLISRKRSYNIASRQMQNRGKSMNNDIQLETYSDSLVLHKAYGAQDDVFPVN